MTKISNCMSKMQKIILSRKGFDSSAGGKPSPIFPNGQMFSIPIPTKYSSHQTFEDIRKGDYSGADALRQVNANKILSSGPCHYDPQLASQEGLFGQVGKVQTELDKHSVSSGDLFLFFGWFRDYSQAERIDVHQIFGWLEIEKIIHGTSKIKDYCDSLNAKHPHAINDYSNNALYVGKKTSVFSSNDLNVPGYGEFRKTNSELVLTEMGKSRSNWIMPSEHFSEEKNPRLFSNRLKWSGENDNRIQCKGYGQEFIIDVDENPSAIDWAKSIICENVKDNLY